ncbi:MAG: hypothetical protein KDC82_04115, partial [Bacteroidetes bacterium]|nr:hypothetical protein [Bacteroidota bacterium]
MNKSLVLYLLSYFFCLLSYSQKEDYTWLLGSGTLNQINFTETDFSLSTLNPDSSLRIHITNASLGDSSGNLLLFSGGTAIYDNLGNIIENGDSINYGYFWEQSSVTPGTYRAVNGAMFIKSLSEDNSFLLLHLKGDTFVNINNYSGLGSEISYTKVSTNDLTVTEKNVSLVSDTLLNSGVTACRHGNGRDWWIMASEGGSNCYYTLLYSPDTIVQVHKQCLGVKSFYTDGGQSLFSPDGSLFIRGSVKDGVEIFDFDRCSGLLSNPRQIPISELELSISNLAVGAVAVSSNNRFLYLISSARILQYDLESEDILASQILIHNSDTATLQNYGFATSQIAPNGEIFISAGEQSKFHIIHQPDQVGVACNLEVKIPLLRPGSYGLPNFPNYRLGALTGSACDTLGVGIKELSTPIEILLNPNPAGT